MKLDLNQSRPNEKVFLNYLQAGISFEPDVANAFVTLLNVGDVAVDVGANCGFFTVLAAMLVGPTGHVVSFEPDPENVARLRAVSPLPHGDPANRLRRPRAPRISVRRRLRRPRRSRCNPSSQSRERAAGNLTLAHVPFIFIATERNCLASRLVTMSLVAA
jgi:hypothetical protein